MLDASMDSKCHSVGNLTKLTLIESLCSGTTESRHQLKNTFLQNQVQTTCTLYSINHTIASHSVSLTLVHVSTLKMLFMFIVTGGNAKGFTHETSESCFTKKSLSNPFAKIDTSCHITLTYLEKNPLHSVL